jgi:hypothetical protein
MYDVSVFTVRYEGFAFLQGWHITRRSSIFFPGQEYAITQMLYRYAVYVVCCMLYVVLSTVEMILPHVSYCLVS